MDQAHKRCRTLTGCLMMSLAVLLAACSSDDGGSGGGGGEGTGGSGDAGAGGSGSTPTKCTRPTEISKLEGVTVLSTLGGQLAWMVDNVIGPATNDGLWLAPLSGANPKQVTTAPKRPKAMVLEAQQVVWGDNDGVWSIPTAGGSPVQLSYGSVRSLVADAKRFYWSDGSSIRSLDRGLEETQGTLVSLFGDLLALGGGHLYALDKKSVTRLALESPDAKSSVVIEGRTKLEAMTLDGDTLYLLDRISSTEGDLLSVPAAGGAARVLASGLLLGSGMQIVVAQGQVYVPGLVSLLQVPAGGGAVRERYCEGGDAAVLAGNSVVWSDAIDGSIWSGKL